jgi:eukaryotic-like serine/threonine-protein kinase
VSAELRDQLQRTLGDGYRLERELGGGGMSRVFVAEELRLDRRVVVKVLSPDLAQGLSADRFEREIRTVAGLQQANIVPVLTAGETDGLPFYTMPFVDGESLRAHLGRGPLPIADVVGILKDVSKALAYAHQRGVVHRDIKPDNVLLSGGTAVVTDFGIAKAISAARTGAGAPTLTQVGTSIGTPAYMAPEQAAGDTNVDHRADIYALGAMAYELLSGQPVFPNRSTQRMLAAHMAEAPRPIGELRADAPASLGDIVMRCLAKDPSERPQSASDVVRVLDTITTGGTAAPAAARGKSMRLRTALAVYVAAFVAVAILAKAAIVGIGLPSWVFPGALIVMALGLPVVLWTGYVQRVTRRAITERDTHGTLASIALRAAPGVSWYKTARGGVLAVAAFVVAVAAFMILRAFGIGPAGSLRAAGRLNARDPIILTDFRTRNVDSTLGRVVSDAVRAGLNGSAAFTLIAPAEIVRTLRAMQRAPDTRLDFSVASEIAQRAGLKAIVDGDVTGVPGGYIVSVRLVRADSGIELASFRETGDGPKGLIEAADKLARALRGKAGESLRAVNATPPLVQATTGSLEALQKYSQAVRLNALGDNRSVAVAREAIALDSTFASAWSVLGATMSNYGLGSRSAIDSALTQAYRYRNRLAPLERDLLIGRYYHLGPGHDRVKGIEAYENILRRGDTTAALLANLGEMLRTRRQYASAESLNIASTRVQPRSGTAYGNAVELQINEGKFTEAAATIARLKSVSPFYAAFEEIQLSFATGDRRRARVLVDSLAPEHRQTVGLPVLLGFSLGDGRLRDFDVLARESIANNGPVDAIMAVAMHAVVTGPSPADLARLDTTIARTPFRDLPMVDRPYLLAAGALARLGSAEKAKAMLARYRLEMTDTTIRREQASSVHNVQAEIALADGKPRDAIAEFRLGDVGYDGYPADECGACLWFDLGRAYDAAGQADSATVMFERYLSTPFFNKVLAPYDPIRVPAIRERLGQLYESMNRPEKAAEQYRAFIELWRNADAELQPRVAEARRRLARLTPVERPR